MGTAKNIAIIGGGASGALTAAGLLRRSSPADRVIVVDPVAELGRGVAFGTTEARHLLNVRAGNMSAYPDDPGHFSRWLIDKGLACFEEASTVFAPRKAFGLYLGDVLCSARGASDGEFVRVRDSAVHIEGGDSLTVVTSQGSRITADHVVLATGNLAPCCPSALRRLESHSRYLANPWDQEAISRIGQHETVFIVGTGLTMVDAFVSLDAQGHTGKVIARSRRGLLPKTHQPCKVKQACVSDLSQGELFHTIRRLLCDSGDDWRAAMDGLRPHTVALWQSLSWAQRRRFLDRLRPFWDVFRHRIPESVSTVVEDARAEGRLEIGADRICALRHSCDAFEIELVGRDAPIRADWIINCTGPKTDIRPEKVPILESAVAEGFASYDPLGMGLMVDDAGRTDPNGRVWAVGPLCKGCRWETTAIPEIRSQAARVAAEIYT